MVRVIFKQYLFFSLFFSCVVMIFSCNNALKSLRSQYSQRFSDSLPFENSQFITINDARIHYRIWKQQGKLKGKIFMLHGLAGSTFSWRNQIAVLTKAGYLLVSLDMPPFGYSDRKKNIDFSLKNNVDIFWKFLDMIDATTVENNKINQWIFMAHSMGNRYISAMALKRPGNVNRIIMVDPSIDQVNNKNAITWIPGMGWVVRGVLKYYILKPSSFKMYATQAYGRVPQENEILGYLAPFMENNAVGSLTKWSTYQKKDEAINLKMLSQPVLLIWGNIDPYAPLKEGHKLDTIIPNAKLFVIPGAAHCPNETHFELCNEEILKFLEK